LILYMEISSNGFSKEQNEPTDAQNQTTKNFASTKLTLPRVTISYFIHGSVSSCCTCGCCETSKTNHFNLCACLCVCVCACERDWERQHTFLVHERFDIHSHISSKSISVSSSLSAPVRLCHKPLNGMLVSQLASF